jgi:hypothetical protein
MRIFFVCLALFFYSNLFCQKVQFTVSDVNPAAEPLAENTYEQLLTRKFGVQPIATSEPWTGTAVFSDLHPMVNALQLSFNDHRPFVLSPDMIWMLILQGFAIQIKENPEYLGLYPPSREKITLTVREDQLNFSNFKNNWEPVISSFSEQIRLHIGEELYDLCNADFSTTTSVEKICYEVAMMDILEDYFSYEVISVCGIPSITLRGTPEDWEKILNKVNHLRDYGLNNWINALEPILEKIWLSSKGQIDKAFWQKIYKRSEASGGPHIFGWIIQFFPYIRIKTGLKVIDGKPYSRDTLIDNPFLGMDPNEFDPNGFYGLTADDFPSGLNSFSFNWKYNLLAYQMRCMAGFIAIEQNNTTKALKPKLGWVILEEQNKKK